MFEGIINFFKRKGKKEEKKESSNSRDTAKERLHLVLMQDRANVSADFLELMKQEIIEVIKKYIEIDEGAIDVRLTNKENEDGTNGAPALYANIPILNIKHDVGKANTTDNTVEEKNTQSDNVKKGYNKESAEADKKGNDSKTDTGTKPEQKNLEENEKQEEKKQENPVENGENSKKDKKPVKTESAQEKKEVKSENVKEKE